MDLFNRFHHGPKDSVRVLRRNPFNLYRQTTPLSQHKTVQGAVKAAQHDANENGQDVYRIRVDGGNLLEFEVMPIVMGAPWPNAIYGSSSLGLSESATLRDQPPSSGYAHGDTYNLSGSGFGADATPLAFDSFDWGSPGDNLENSPNAPWSTRSNNGPTDPEISTLQAYGQNTRSGMHNGDSGGNPQGGDSLTSLDGQDTLTGYMSLMHRYEITGSPTTHKGVRMQGTGGPSIFTAYPSMFVQDYWTDSNRITYTWTTDSDDQASDSGPDAYPENQWNRLEYWYVMDDPNGVIQSWVNLTQDSLRNAVTLASGVSQSITNFLLPFYFRNGGSGIGWYNDVYISDTQARVEIGNASSWAGCTIREIQNPSAWSDSSITITVNKGNLSAGTNYIYTVDSSGNATQQGTIEIA